jgi:hypothetical protein
MYYKYNHNTNNIKIPIKKQEGKDIIDEKRLNLFFSIYCKLLYPELSSEQISKLLEKLKSSSKKFIDNIETIKNFKMIDDIFKKNK